jgi:hypothetical protein
MGTSFRGFRFTRAERLADDDGVSVSLVHRTRSRTKEWRWSQPTLTSSAAEPLRVRGVVRQTGPDAMTGLFQLPVSRLPNGPSFASVPIRLAPQSVTLNWPGGTAQLPAATGDGSEIAKRAFPIPAEVLRQIAAAGGLFEVTIRSNTPTAETTSSIELWGKS